VDDIACAVLATVISHRRAEGRVIIDAGGLGLSKDRSTDGASFDAGYGLVASAIDGRLLDGLRVGSVHQEHGEITVTDPATFEAHPIGSKLRVLPNHICMTAAMYDRYHLVGQPDGAVRTWLRTNGWRPYDNSLT
jgi:D-serine deaminase-like pyridoxal phosphate-dependent protein